MKNETKDVQFDIKALLTDTFFRSWTTVLVVHSFAAIGVGTEQVFAFYCVRAPG